MKDTHRPIRLPFSEEMIWQGENNLIQFSENEIRKALLEVDRPVWVIENQGRVGLAPSGKVVPGMNGPRVLGFIPAFSVDDMGDMNFNMADSTRSRESPPVPKEPINPLSPNVITMVSEEIPPAMAPA